MRYPIEALREQIVGLLPRLRRFARILAGNSADADHLTQIAMERAFAHSAQLLSDSQLATWLFGIMRDAWLGEARAQLRRSGVFLAQRGAARKVGVAREMRESTSADRTTAANDPRMTTLFIRDAIACLPDEERSALASVLIEGLSCSESAEILEVPDSVVMGCAANLDAALDKMLDEPVPERLIVVARTTAAIQRGSNVIPLRRKPRLRWTWPRWGAIVASLMIGAVAGQIFQRSRDTVPITTRNGQLLATGALARALSNQLARDDGSAAVVKVDAGFRAKSGDYCRTFLLREENQLVGLACHTHDTWHVLVLTQSEESRGSASPRMPRAVLQAIDDQRAPSE
jgi:RNA polymerase sigma-70 factor (ECF subfamily)